MLRLFLVGGDRLPEDLPSGTEVGVEIQIPALGDQPEPAQAGEGQQGEQEAQHPLVERSPAVQPITQGDDHGEARAEDLEHLEAFRGQESRLGGMEGPEQAKELRPPKQGVDPKDEQDNAPQPHARGGGAGQAQECDHRSHPRKPLQTKPSLIPRRNSLDAFWLAPETSGPVPFAICNEIYHSDPSARSWTHEAILEHAARTGYDALELTPYTVCRRVTEVSAAERTRLRDSACRAGVPICGIHWLLARTEGFHITHPDPGVRERTARYLVDLVDFGADLGGRILVFGSPKQRSLEPGVEYARAWDDATAVFRDAVHRAEDRGVVLCFEPLAPSETDFVNTAAEARRFAAQFESPAMKIILDVKAMSSEEIPIPDIIRASVGHFAHFHANDSNLKGPGFGEVDFRPIASALREVGYQGQISVEVFRFEEGPEVIAERSLACLRSAFGSEP